jgi:hypothetical protein
MHRSMQAVGILLSRAALAGSAPANLDEQARSTR